MARGTGSGAIRAGAGFLFALALAAPAGAALDPAARARIQAAVFEVVVPKPTKDSLSYEKPLPLDLIPFRERNDKYFPVGTAFAIGDGRYVTAAHVLGIGQRTQYDAPALRDGAGALHEIDRIVKYALDQDFVVFTLKNAPAVTALQVGAKPAVNDTVYAIGNALGEGIVTRDGVFTSETPEDQDGRWNWLRFSAPASPGNSGGPLLDDHGAVIGVVMRKSPNENLNYALPIDLVLKAREDVGTVDTRATYRFSLLDATETETLKDQVTLPRTLSDLNAIMDDKTDQFGLKLLKDLLAHNADAIFPHGPGSAQTLVAGQFRVGTVPSLMARKTDGNWDVVGPTNVSNAELPHNARVSLGGFQDGMTALSHIQRPDDVAAAAFYADSKAYGDMLVKAVTLTRVVGPETIRITSLGKAETDTVFVDSYRRKWQLRTWPMEFSDQVVLSLALPVPDGYATIVKQVPTTNREQAQAELQVMADFVSVLYYGRFDQWKEFLEQSALLPDMLSSIKIKIDYDHAFEYRSPRFSFSFTPALQAITKDGAMFLRPGYFEDKGKVVWDVRLLNVLENYQGRTQCALARHVRPPNDMPDWVKGNWYKIAHGLHPYTDLPYAEDGNTTIQSVIHAAAATDDPPILFSANCTAEGQKDAPQMKAKLDTWTKDLKVYE